MKLTAAQSLEWFGVLTAIVYSLLVASNTGLEFLGFALLLISAFSIGLWAYLGGHRGILLLQFVYATAGIIGMLRWFWSSLAIGFFTESASFVVYRLRLIFRRHRWFVERVGGIEPPSPAWKAGVIAFIRYPQAINLYQFFPRC